MSGRSKRKKYHDRIARGLDEALVQAPVEEADAEELRLVVFSDLHRGIGDRADDFRKCRRIYHAALGFYESLDYRLFLLGDVEEMWERFLWTIVGTYKHTLELERSFFERGRGERFVGNHDEGLQWPWNFRHVRPYLGGRPLLESLRIRVSEEGKELGELFFAHGHQGINYHWYHRFAVRSFWAPWQILTGIGPGVPSIDRRLRRTHERSMYDWAAAHDRHLLLICGHTHNPVFMSTAWQERVRETLDRMSGDPDTDPAELAMMNAKLRWAEASADESRSALPEGAKPCYFNTGCCSFPEGNITGIEIAGGSIRLIHWTGRNGKPERSVLREAELRKVFRNCCG